MLWTVDSSDRLEIFWNSVFFFDHLGREAKLVAQEAGEREQMVGPAVGRVGGDLQVLLHVDQRIGIEFGQISQLRPLALIERLELAQTTQFGAALFGRNRVIRLLLLETCYLGG